MHQLTSRVVQDPDGDYEDRTVNGRGRQPNKSSNSPRTVGRPKSTAKYNVEPTVKIPPPNSRTGSQSPNKSPGRPKKHKGLNAPLTNTQITLQYLEHCVPRTIPTDLGQLIRDGNAKPAVQELWKSLHGIRGAVVPYELKVGTNGGKSPRTKMKY